MAPTNAVFEDVFLFPKVGYISFPGKYLQVPPPNSIPKAPPTGPNQTRALVPMVGSSTPRYSSNGSDTTLFNEGSDGEVTFSWKVTCSDLKYTGRDHVDLLTDLSN